MGRNITRSLIAIGIGGTAALALSLAHSAQSPDRRVELQGLLSRYDALRAEGVADADPRVRALKDAIDQVARQKDAHASRLFWHTDLPGAVAAARAQGKPILSLRLLGRLDEELSCANSRFFRVALYANGEVSRLLRERFVLHWSSERPAPKITIDMGDGRRVVRTITGNSIHYVLDRDGHPIDALPGLYAPKPFADALLGTIALEGRLAPMKEGARANALLGYHLAARTDIESRWRKLTGRSLAALPTAAALPNAPPPTARRAAPIAMAKAMVEVPTLRRWMPPDTTGAGLQPMRRPSREDDPAFWRLLVGRAGVVSRLDAQSRALMREKAPHDYSDPSRPRALDAREIDLRIAAFERVMAADTLRNELQIRAEIHRWFAAQPAQGFEALNTRVYRDLFLTPRSDPWLGLVPPALSAIAGDGIVVDGAKL